MCVHVIGKSWSTRFSKPTAPNIPPHRPDTETLSTAAQRVLLLMKCTGGSSDGPHRRRTTTYPNRTEGDLPTFKHCTPFSNPQSHHQPLALAPSPLVCVGTLHTTTTLSPSSPVPQFADRPFLGALHCTPTRELCCRRIMRAWKIQLNL